MFDLAGVLLDFGGVESVARLSKGQTDLGTFDTNVLDVRRFRDELNLPAYFDACFFSNEIGHRKPSPGSYLHVLRAFGLASLPDRALFFDDSPACVEGARKVGMQAHRACGVGEVHSCLAALGVAWSDGL